MASFASNVISSAKRLLSRTASPVVTTPIVSEGVPFTRKAAISGIGEPVNLSRADLTAEKVQSAISIAERGDTRQLFQLYRDSIASYAHIQTELGKRKMAVLAKIQTIAPANKADAADKAAADAIQAMIEDCESWDRSLMFMMDSCLYPVTVSEKLFRVPVPGDSAYKLGLRYTLNKIEKVDPFLYCFQLPYMPTMGEWNPNDWEPDLRFYTTMLDGMINYSVRDAYPPDPDRHIVYRGNFLTSQRDNFGGPMRSVLLWWYLATKGRDWWGRFMERFGVPFPVIKADMTDISTRNMVSAALKDLTKIFGLGVNKDAEVELCQAATANTAEAWDRFTTFCHCEISKVIVGQTLSSKPQGTGMGSGVANLQSDVREDIRAFDEKQLCDTLKRQLFRYALAINGLTGSAPNVLWGGMSESDQHTTSETISNLALAGLQVTDDGIDQVSHKMGLPFERKPEPVTPNGDTNGSGNRPRPTSK